MRDWLITHGWDDIFLDLDPERGLKAGQRWQEALKHAAERCEAVIFLVSPAWRASEWCVAEFLLAKQMNKRIVGVIVDPIPLQELPVEMTPEWQLVDLTAGARNFETTVTLPPADVTVTVSFPQDGPIAVCASLRLSAKATSKMVASSPQLFFIYPRALRRSCHQCHALT